MGKHFFNKLLNADDAPNVLDAAELIDLRNMRFGTSESGELGGLENIKGTLQKYAVGRTINNITTPPIYCIGSTADEDGRFIAWFTHSPADANNPVWDAIWLYDIGGQTAYPVLDSMAVNATHDLNFDPAHLIHSARIVNDTLYWTDGLNPPRSIHLGSAINWTNDGTSPLPAIVTYTSVLNGADYSLCKLPFPLAVTLVKSYDAAYPTSRIADESFQFAVRYVYFGGEKSVLSPWSATAFVNKASDNYNRIKVTMPTAIPIPQGVRLVQLVVLFGSTKQGAVAKTFDRLNTDDAAAIVNHNAGFTGLQFYFYNNALEEAVDSSELILFAHAVPDIVRTLEVARDRLFLSNYTEGKDTPTATSLQVALNTTQNGIFGKPVHLGWQTHTNTADRLPVTYDLIATYLDTGSQIGWFGVNSTVLRTVWGTGGFPINVPDQILYPAYVNIFSDITYCGADIVDVINHYSAGDLSIPAAPSINTEYQDQFIQAGGENPPPATHFKSGGSYQWGVVFYDEFLKKCGVVTNSDLVTTALRKNYNFTQEESTATWTLNNDNAASEIPAWAKYYSIVRTLNLKTRNFLEWRETDVMYFKHKPDGTWDTPQAAYDVNCRAMGISVATLVSYGLGYDKVTPGDVIRVMDRAGEIAEGQVIGMSGLYVLFTNFMPVAQAFPIAGTVYAVEIYTPYVSTGVEAFYEIGAMFPIVNGNYSVLTGNIAGDTFSVPRSKAGEKVAYYMEAMNINDLFWKRWDTDAGRINVVTRLGKATVKTGLRYSETFIPGTSTNGLSDFEALNQQSLPVELGEVMKLQLTSKAQSEGTVMLGIGKTETCSVYLGEGQLSDTSGNSTLIRSVNVVGQINVLKGSLGTIHPESVVVRKGRVFWLDVLKGVIAAYAENGLFEQSTYKLRRAAKLACRGILAGNIKNIPGGFDTFHGEYLLSMPQTEVSAPMGQLEDYEGMNYPYDFYDGVAKVWVAKVDHDRFQGSYDFSAEYFVSVGEGLFSFKNGALWEHNVGAFDSIYGQTIKPSLAFVENGDPDSIVKVFDALSLEANMTPSWTHIRTEALEDTPYWQSSDLVAGDWKQLEGVRYAPVYRDRLSPNVAGSAEEKMLKGDTMRGQWAKIKMEFTTGGSRLVVRFVNVIYRKSKGHLNI